MPRSFFSLVRWFKNRMDLVKSTRRRVNRRANNWLEQLESRIVLSANVTGYHQAIPGTSSPSTIGAGVNSNETTLTPANVNSTDFGKLFSTKVDGQVYAQPLYMENVNITTGALQGTHNIAIVATQHDSLYAIDATTGAILWQDALLAPEHGGTVTSVSSNAVGSSDISPEIGITATPIIDPATGVIFVENKTQEVASDGTHFEHHLYAIDLQTGGIINNTLIADSIGDTYVSGPSVAGNGAGSINGVVHFDALRQMDRPGLSLVNGNLFLAFASHGDNGPYHGWILGYSETTLAPVAVFNANPNGADDGIWQGGGSLQYETVGGNTFFYFETGNGSFDTTLVQSPFNPNLMIPNGGDYGDSFVKVEFDGTTAATNSLNATNNINGWGLHVADYFTPTNEGNLSNGDTDLGSGGPLILPASAGSAAHQNLLVGSGKEGRIYLMDRNNMGGYGGDAAGDGNSGTDNVVQETTTGAINASFDTPTFFNGQLYYVGGYGDVGRTFNIANGAISTNSVTQSTDGYPFPGSTPTISSDPTGNNAVVWDIGGPGTNQLRAYNASNGYGTEIYTSGQAAGSRDSLGTSVKFSVATVADGEVFLGTTNSFVAYGLFQPATAPPNAPTNLSASAFSGSVINLTWTDNDKSPNSASAYNIYQSTDGVNFVPVGTASAGATSFAVGGLKLSTKYYYEVSATNSQGTSTYTNIASATTTSQAATLDFSSGFGGSTSVLTYNGNAVLNGTAAQLTDGGYTEAGSVFSTNAVDVSTFSTQFNFQLNSAGADGFTFTIQGNGPTALGGTGGYLGYQGINNSVAIKFDIYDNAGEGTDSTGLFTNGAVPFTPSIDLSGTGIQLNSGDVFRTLMTYDGTTLNVTITDTSTGATATQSYAVNIPQIVGGNTAYVGFTGGTGGLTAVQDILTWAYSPNASTTPAAPTGLTGAVISGSEVDLSWTDNSNNETSFLIYRSTDGVNFSQIASVGANITAYHDTSLVPGETVYYQVQATNAAGGSDFSNVFQATTAIPPSPPTNLQATNITTNEVDLSWTNVATNATGIKILAQQGKNTARVIAAGLSPNTTSYKIVGLSAGTSYVFEIDALNSSGPSGAASITADTLPGQVTGLTATATSGAISLNWNADPGAQTYNIYRSTSAAIGSVPTWTGASGTTYVDSNTVPGTTYYYEVSAVDPNAASPGLSPASSAGESAISSQVSAVALPPGINDSTGFSTATGLALNGSAQIVGNNLQLTDSGGSEAGSAFATTTQYVGAFATQFDFQINPGSTPTADGFTFAIQGNSPTALGPSGGGLGYGPDNTGGAPGIPNSVAIKFDLYNNAGEGVDSTGLYTNGAAPTNIGSLDLTGAIDLHSGDVMRVNLAYDGSNLSETILDTVTGGTFTHTYAGVNIPSIVGSNGAYVGFTGGTGGLTAVQDIQAWTFTPSGANTFNAPTSLTGVAQNGPQVQLTWNDNSNLATSFNIERATDPAFAQNVTILAAPAPTTPTATYVDTTIIPGNTYYYRVQAVSGTSATVYSNPVSEVIPSPPATPTNGHATLITDTSVNLAWTNNATNADEYKIFREVVGSSFSLIATLPASATSFSDSGLLPGTNYDYHIEAWNISGAADRTGANLWTVSQAITSLTNSSNGGPVKLTWTAPAGSSLLTYNVYRGTTAGAEGAVPIATGLSTPSFSDNGVVAGKTYFYVVTSVDPNSQATPSVAPFGESTPSNEVTLHVPLVTFSKLAFQQSPPTSGTAGVALGSAVTVAVEDKSGNVLVADNSIVTLTLSTGLFSTGTKTVTAQAVNGVATFNNLTINTTGVYQLIASDGTLTAVRSTSLTINPSTATQFLITSPTTGIAGSAFLVRAVLKDAFGNVVTTDSSSTATISATGPGLFSVGTTTSNTVSVTVNKGIASFVLYLKTTGSYSLTVTDGAVQSVLPALTIDPSVARKLVFQSPPATAGTAGTALSSDVVVAVEDYYNNLVPTDTSLVTLTIGPAVFTANAIGGIATFPGLNSLPSSTLLINKAGTFSPIVTDGTLTGAIAPHVVISPSIATQFVITSPTTGTAGAPFAVKVILEDSFGNVVTTDSTSTVTISESGPGLFTVGTTTSNTVSLIVTKGIATFNLDLKTAGNYTLTATDGGVQSVLSALTITPNVARKLVFQSSPSTTGTAGTALSTDVVVAVEDAFSNLILGDTSQVTLTIGNGIFTANAVAGIATFPGLNSTPGSTLIVTKTGTFAPIATDGTLFRAVAPNVVINPSTAAKFAITSPTMGVAGAPFAVRVVLQDTFGNTVTTDSTSTVTISASGPGPFSIGTTTSGGVSLIVNKGIANFSLDLKTAGIYTLTVTDGFVESVLPTLTITPNVARKLVFQSPPATTGIAGTALNSDVVVAVEDIFNNLISGDTSQITLTIGPAVFSANAVGGIATFPGLNSTPTSTLVINKAGTFAPIVTDGTLYRAVAAYIVINPSTATQFVITSPTTGTAGAGFIVTAILQDAFGNTVTTDSTSTVTISATGPGPFTVGATTSGGVSAIVNRGIATFQLDLKTAGNYTLTATDGSVQSVLPALTIVPAAAYKLAFQTPPSTTGTAGTALGSDVVVAVEDGFNNLITGNSSKVTLTIGTSVFTADVIGGIATFLGLNSTPGSTLIVTKAGAFIPLASDGTLLKVAAPKLTISPSSARQIAFISVPATGKVGTAIGVIQIAIEDLYGNTVVGDNSLVTLTITTGPVTNFKNGSTVSVQIHNGVASISSVSFTTAGTYTIMASDGGLTAAVSGNIVIS